MLPVLALIVLLAVAADSQSSATAGDLRPPSKEESAMTTPKEGGATTDPTPTAATLQLFNDDPESELKFFESIRDEIKALGGGDALDDDGDDSKDDSKKSDEDGFVSVTVIDPEEDQSTVRRQGDLHPEFGQRRTRPGVEFDDPPAKAEDRFPPPPPRPDADGSPLLQLTQGGYRRPYDAPEQKQGSESPPRPETSDGSRDMKPRVEPQVSYTSSFRQPRFGFGPGPILRSPFAAPPRNFVSHNNIIPTTVQNAFLNTPPAGFTDYMNFQAQFPTDDNAGYANWRDPSAMPLFQSPGGLLFQSSPQYQQMQPVVIDPSRALQEQLLSGSYETVEDGSRPDYAAYFRHPTPMSHPQFQVPPNFYGANPNAPGDATFHSPLGNFHPNGPASSPFSPRFIQYPSPGNSASPDVQQQPEEGLKENNQQPKEEERTEDKTGDPMPIPFGTRLQTQPQSNVPSQTDFYMRYPMREAGYATEESLPSQNGTENGNPSPRVPRRFFPRPPPFGRDPYRDALNVLQQQPSTNTQIGASNRSHETSPEEFFRSGQLPFAVPQGVVAYPDRNQDFPGSPVFYPAPGNAFQLPDTSFQFLNPSRANAAESESKATPSCALQSNASVCFEDEDYPRQDVLFSLNADAPLVRRFTVLPPQGEEERNGSAEGAGSLCAADVTRGAPLRARNAAGSWKVLVNLDRGVGGGRFAQTIRLEVCRSSGEPCSHTDGKVKTSCVQKYSLQSLLSWSRDRGVHSDLYRLPVACSCQLLQA